MIDWGIPDWRDESAYLNQDGNTLWGVWRWEFVRRHSDYRKTYEDFASRSFSSDEEKDAESLRLARPIRYTRMYDPRSSEIHEIEMHYSSGVIMHNAHPSKFNYDPVIHPPERHIVLMSFNVDMPIEEQIEAARGHLTWVQKRAYGKKIEFRNEPSRWPLYLRVLDARVAGASWTEVTSIMPAAYQTKENARSVHKQALGVQDKFLYYPTLPGD